MKTAAGRVTPSTQTFPVDICDHQALGKKQAEQAGRALHLALMFGFSHQNRLLWKNHNSVV